MTRSSAFAFATHLVVVPCHAIWVGRLREHIFLPECWVGGHPGYRYDDQFQLYVDHIRAAIVIAAGDPHAIVVFSGGFTVAPDKFGERQVISESRGYLNVARASDWFNCASVADRAFLDEYARDSYENVRNAHLRFLDLAGTPPAKVTVVGVSFKKTRFELHADAIRRRPDVGHFRFDYIGVNNPPHYVHDAGARYGEMLTLDAFKTTPHGDDGELLAKRLRRDPLGRGAYRATSVDDGEQPVP